MHLVAQHGLEKGDGSASKRIDMVRRLVNAIRSSSRASHILHTVQRNAGRNERQLITDAPTRWLSVYDMLECFLNQRECIQAVALSGALNDYEGDVPATMDWPILSFYLKVIDMETHKSHSTSASIGAETVETICSGGSR